MDRSQAKERWPVGGSLTMLLLAFLAFSAAQGGWLETLDHRLSDARSSIVTHNAKAGIVLVDIDARSLREVGVWPWPRHLHAGLVEAADRAGARAIAFDIDFSARGEGDAAFALALARAGAQTFLAAFVQDVSVGSADEMVSMPTALLLESSWPAAVNVPLERDGRIRRFVSNVQTDGELLSSMPALLADRAASGDVFGINFSIDAASIPRISYVDLIEGRVARERIEGRTLVVGATAIELRDFFRVPNQGVVSGSTVIALAAETLFQNLEMESRPAPGWSYGLLAAFGIAGMLGLGPRPMLFALPGVALSLEAGALWLHHGAQLSVGTAGLQLALGAIAVIAILRAFDLKTILLGIARMDASNSRLMLERVIEEGFDAIVVLDETGHVVRSNDAARELPLLPGGRPGVPPSLRDFPLEVRLAVEAMRSDPDRSARIRRDVEIAADDGRRVLEYSLARLDLQARDRRRPQAFADERLVCLTLRDVTQVRLAQEHLQALAMQDSLTGLGNRRALEARLAERPADDGAVSLFVFDLDRFKEVNDLLGHAVGDIVLCEVAQRVRSVFDPDAILARIGGDKFAAVADDLEREELQALARALWTCIERPILVKGHRVSVGVSSGIAIGRTQDGDVRCLLAQADLALHRAKQATGPARVAVFEPAMEETRQARLELEREFLEAVEQNRFELVYQAQAEMRSGRVIGAEALLRWNHAVRGPISPQIFIPLAEETGLIHRLGSWALLQACRDAAAWPEEISIAVNVSSVQLQVGDLVEVVEEVLGATGLAPSRLELEITESAFVRDGPALAQIFETLRARGIRFALDDFGTGYSSLGYLHRFPISKIKIDKSFVNGLPGNGACMAIVRSVMALASGLGIRCIAEGIESPEQARCLSLLGCREGQGYLFHRPLTAEAMLDLWHTPARVTSVL